jgi:D-galactosaminyltransferase
MAAGAALPDLARAAHTVTGTGHLGSHTSAVSFGYGVLVALLLLVGPGAIVARCGGLRWPASVAVGPTLTYGAVAMAIVPFGALGVRWDAASALAAVAVVTVAVICLRAAIRRVTSPPRHLPVAPPRGAALLVAAGVLLGAGLIFLAAARGLPSWQSIPSTWDAVWHANTIRFILDTGQASPTHMGELRNVETHEALYYPSAFHALGAVYAQLAGAAPTTAYTVMSVAVSCWLFPVSAAVLAWQLLHRRIGPWPTAGAAATAAALSASFTAVPYVEFDTASIPNLAAYGIAVPAFVLVTTALTHRDRVPMAVLAVVGVFSVHITGGVVTALLVAGWWLAEALVHPVRGRLADGLTLAAVGVPALALLLPQFLGVLQQAEIIEGHSFVTHQGRKRALFDAVVQHTRHLNDYPVQWWLIGLAAVGGVLLVARRVWWPVPVWLLLVVSIVHSSAPFGGPVGTITGTFSDLFYSDPRRLSAVVALLVSALAGIAACTIVAAIVAWIGQRRSTPDPRIRHAAGGALLTAMCVVSAVHYLPRHQFMFGEKYDSVIIDARDLQAFAHLASLPGAKDTLVANANTDGTAWMYAVADLHPLWTHYDYPVQQGPGYHRFVIWAYADDADTDPRVAEAVAALHIRYLLVSTPVVRGFVIPDGLASLDKSHSWEKIYDNGEARIYRWRGARPE